MLTMAELADINAGINPPPRVRLIKIGLINAEKSLDRSMLEDTVDSMSISCGAMFSAVLGWFTIPLFKLLILGVNVLCNGI